MVRFFLSGAALAALVACQPAVPDSGVGVTSAQASAARDAQLAGLPAPAPVDAGTPLDPAARPLPASVTAAVTGDSTESQAAAAAAAANSGVAPVDASPSNPPPAVVNSSGISSEQNFDAVSAERSIESDAQRLAANRAQYQVIAPTDLPVRPGTNTPNIVEYALRTNNPVGTQIYRRTNVLSAQRYARNCAGYESPAAAQTDFLSRGGPERDRRGLDPDGDGFACDWNPTPFRAARQSSAPAAASPATPATTTSSTAPTATAPTAPTTTGAPGVSVVPPLAISTE